MKDYEIVIKIGAFGMNKDEALEQYSDILDFIQKHLPLENYQIDIKEIGEYV